MYSTTEGTESVVFKAEGKMVGISPQQIVAYDTTDDDCNGVDLITILNFVMDAGCIDSIACINSDADYSETSSRSWWSVHTSVVPSSTNQNWWTGWDQYPCREGALFQRVPPPITSRKKGTRDDQQFHYSLEGGDFGGYRTQGLVCHRTDNEHTTKRRKDRNRGEAPHYCGRVRSFDGEFGNECDETLHPSV